MNFGDLEPTLTCDCGHQFAVSIARMEAEHAVTCPACHETSTISEDTLAKLRSDVQAFVDQVRQAMR